MNKHHIELTDEEKDLVSRVDLREALPPDADGHAIYLANQQPILALLKSLIGRKAIPEHRISYWTDPRYRTGRMKGSHRDIFARNGTKGTDAYIHPHFKPFLRYFLYGADLPQDVIDEFEKQVGNPEWFSGSDIIDLTKKTREIIGRHGLSDWRLVDEFHKLALDNGLSASNAEAVRKAAGTAVTREFKR